VHPEGLPDDTLRIQLEGTGGQSFGAFLARGITLYLIGDANDYTGKGLSGGRVVVRPASTSAAKRPRTSSSATPRCTVRPPGGFLQRRRRRALRRAPVRRHGRRGRHGRPRLRIHDRRHRWPCSGKTGRNFAAGMSGGIAYVYDEDGKFASRCNTAMVSLERRGQHRRTAGRCRHGTKLHRDQSDEALLKKLLEDHNRWTGSRRARDLLDNWAESRMKFVKVFPNEYKRALAEMHEREVELASVGNDAQAALKQEPVPAK
jgi:glutamate synthase (NADPH/NADH) large chain/glutamate synthase (ferredoxin)